MIRYRFYIGLTAVAMLPMSCSHQVDIPALREGETVSRILLSRSADGYTAIIAPRAAESRLMALSANDKNFTVSTNTALESGNTTNVDLPEASGDGVGVFVHYGDNDPGNADNLKLSDNMIEHVWKGMDEKPHIAIYSPYDTNARYGNIPLTHGTDHCFVSVNADEIRNCCKYVVYKDLKALTADMKEIYSAPNRNLPAALDRFEEI